MVARTRSFQDQQILAQIAVIKGSYAMKHYGKAPCIISDEEWFRSKLRRIEDSRGLVDAIVDM
jgi:hypothetical protein